MTPLDSIATPEWNILLAASVAEPDESGWVRLKSTIQSNDGKIDWGRVLALADHHGSSSLVYRNFSQLGNAVPMEVSTALRERYELNVRKALFLARELIRILDCLNAMGVEVFPYKGVALSEAYYGDIALRSPGDIDLFVRGQDVARITTAVRDLGYTTRVPIPEDAGQDYLAFGYECTFDSPAGKNLLELKWALQPRFYAVDFDMNGMFERVEEASIVGRRVKTPAPEDLLLVLAVHGAKHVWGRLIWLCDIAQILKRKNLDWDRAQFQAREFGIERILHVTLLLANRLLGMVIPSAIEASILADRSVRDLTGEVMEAVAAGVSYEARQIFYFRLMMRLRERKIDRLRFLTRLTFTPGPGEWDAIRLPRALFPLYRVVRMARLAARFTAGVKS